MWQQRERAGACVKERTVSSGGGGGACGGRSAGRWRGGAGACVWERGAAAATARRCTAEVHGWHALESCGSALSGGWWSQSERMTRQKLHVVVSPLVAERNLHVVFRRREGVKTGSIR